jgi:hypothetical protein
MQKFADRGFRKHQKVRKVPLSLITPPRMQPDYYGWMSALDSIRRMHYWFGYLASRAKAIIFGIGQRAEN